LNITRGTVHFKDYWLGYLDIYLLLSSIDFLIWYLSIIVAYLCG
jgi:hypothetical protein